jgi:hypothetical protein
LNEASDNQLPDQIGRHVILGRRIRIAKQNQGLGTDLANLFPDIPCHKQVTAALLDHGKLP